MSELKPCPFCGDAEIKKFDIVTEARKALCMEQKSGGKMKVEYKYLTFIELPPKPKTKMFDVMNKQSNDWLGVVRWNAQWRRYCLYTSEEQLVFDASCLEDIAKFIRELMIDRIAERRSK